MSINRTLPDYSNVPLCYLCHDDLVNIELGASALTIEECYDRIFVDPNDLTKRDIQAAKLAWRKGRASSIKKAADSLFSSMSGRNGGSVALDYLNIMADNFTVQKDVANTQSGFTFNVEIPDK